jgi:anti-sigma-K factor RskA
VNIQDYISSGILELYATGALTSAEMREVEEMARQHEAIRQELESIELAMETYAMAHAVTPSLNVLNNILAQVEHKEKAETKVINMDTTRNSDRRFRMLAFAASILLFISLIANIYYYSSYNRVSGELADLRDDNLFLTDQYETLKAGYSTMEKDLAMMQDPAVVAITMKGTPNSPSSTTVVFWNKGTGDVYISANNLPKPAEGKQYQLWALKDGKPIDAGVFTMEDGMQHMKTIMAADAFAVTLEPMGGSVAPTLEQLYVMAGV